MTIDLEAELARLTSERDDAHASRNQALRAVDAAQVAQRATYNTTRARLVRMRRYITRHDLQIGECVAWNEIKSQFGVGLDADNDNAWLATYQAAAQARELFPPTAESPADATAIRAIGLAKRAADPSDADGSGWSTKASEDG